MIYYNLTKQIAEYIWGTLLVSCASWTRNKITYGRSAVTEICFSARRSGGGFSFVIYLWSFVIPTPPTGPSHDWWYKTAQRPQKGIEIGVKLVAVPSQISSAIMKN